MSGFDTSGYVPEYGNEAMVTLWSDLNPFTQGYVEALLSDAATELWVGCGGTDPALHGYDPLGFSNLAPEPLARIMEDCVRWKASFPCASTPEQGAALWNSRQDPTGYFTGWNLDFPPLTPYLGDDGKVYLRDAPSPSSDRGGS